MNPGQLTASVTAVANAIAGKLTVNEMAMLAAIFVQIGDTLATIATQRALCEEKDETVK